MARNQTLAQVRYTVKAETGKNLDSSSTAQDAEINQLISNAQMQLAGSYDWPFLKSRWNSSLVAGTRYQAFPTVNDRALTTAPAFERPMQMMVKWNNIWQFVVYGIDDYPEFNYLDSDRNQMLDPVQRWQFSDETNFEVWPLPASTATCQFVGQRSLTSLQTGAAAPPVWNDSATLDLDDQLVAYFAATEYLLRENDPKAQYEAAKAQKRLLSLLGSYPTRTETICIGKGQNLGRRAIRNIPLVLVAGR